MEPSVWGWQVRRAQQRMRAARSQEAGGKSGAWKPRGGEQSACDQRLVRGSSRNDAGFSNTEATGDPDKISLGGIMGTKT